MKRFSATITALAMLLVFTSLAPAKAEAHYYESVTNYYYVSIGVEYYETAQKTGKHFIICDENPYIGNDRKVAVYGYAIVDKKNNVIEERVEQEPLLVVEEQIIASKDCKIMKLIGGIDVYQYGNTMLGWVDADALKETPEEFDEDAYANYLSYVLETSIKKDYDNGVKSIIIADFSEEMRERSQLIYEKLWEREEYPNIIDVVSINSIVNKTKVFANKNPDAHLYLITNWKNCTEADGDTTIRFNGDITIIQYDGAYPIFSDEFNGLLEKATIIPGID